ncbi:hypothetical protein EON65_35745 [archaeon]|nr:MAG: hypothetical protein EON65_35745 [archaeon]
MVSLKDVELVQDKDAIMLHSVPLAFIRTFPNAKGINAVFSTSVLSELQHLTALIHCMPGITELTIKGNIDYIHEELVGMLTEYNRVWDRIEMSYCNEDGTALVESQFVKKTKLLAKPIEEKRLLVQRLVISDTTGYTFWKEVMTPKGTESMKAAMRENKLTRASISATVTSPPPALATSYKARGCPPVCS